MHGLYLTLVVLYQVIAIVAVVHVVMDNRQPAKTMAWALVIYFVPVAGIVLYLFFGLNTRKERLISQRSLDQLSKRSMLGFVEQQNLQLPAQQKPIIDLFINETFALPFQGRVSAIHTDGYSFTASLLRAIAGARSHIHIDMYIFEDDSLGQLIGDALVAKARSGVEVRIIYDDVGCWSVNNRFFEHLREEGIEAVPFLPVRFPSFASKVNYRNHRKIIVIDGTTGFIGGMNLALRYVKGRKKKGLRTAVPTAWRDTMAEVRGNAVYGLQRAFLIDWYFVDRTLLSDRKYYPPTPPDAAAADTTLMQTVTTGPMSSYPEIMQGYVRIILSAKQYVYMETPYFLPTEPVFFAMKTAAVSGIDVRILVPQTGDAWFADWGSRSFLREAHEAGIHVGFYANGFLHSKLLVSDDNVSSCGSTNVDFRSFENNFESNMFFYGEETAKQMRDIFLSDEAQSVPFSASPDLLHPRFHVRLCESAVRLLAPVM